MILKDMLIMKKYSYNMDECNENDSSLYLCHDPCPLTYTKREDRLNKCGGLVSALQLTHPPSSLSHTLCSLSDKCLNFITDTLQGLPDRCLNIQF